MKSQQTLQNLKKSAVAGAVAAALFTPSALAQTTTAQSAMLALELVGEDFVIDGTEVFRFDNEAAAAFYTNQADLSSAVFVKCTPTSRCQGAVPPPAPPPLDSSTAALADVVTADKCTFFNGGKLSSSTYTQEVTTRVGSPPNHLDFTFRYTYNIDPTVNNVQKETAWVEESSQFEFPLVTLSGFIAGQSSQLQAAKKNTPERFKTSHSILDQQGNTRITDLVASLAFTPAGGGGSVLLDAPVLSTGEIRINEDFNYLRTPPAVNGSSGQLVDLASPDGTAPIDGWLVSEIQQGISNGSVVLSNDGLHQDNFDGNDQVGGERVFIQDVDIELTEAGTYALTVSATVKGVQGTKDTSVSATESISVDAEGCVPTS